jgi:hypothetical protein
MTAFLFLTYRTVRSSVAFAKIHRHTPYRATTTAQRPYQPHSFVAMSDLTTWAQEHISTMYEAGSESDLHQAFEATFSPSTEIFVNHEKVSRESLKDDLTKRRVSCVSASVKWENVMAAPNDVDKPDEVRLCCIINGKYILNPIARRAS